MKKFQHKIYLLFKIGGANSLLSTSFIGTIMIRRQFDFFFLEVKGLNLLKIYFNNLKNKCF